jgi:hypothetical protein
VDPEQWQVFARPPGRQELGERCDQTGDFSRIFQDPAFWRTINEEARSFLDQLAKDRTS